jgi:hypothetical protein
MVKHVSALIVVSRQAQVVAAFYQAASHEEEILVDDAELRIEVAAGVSLRFGDGVEVERGHGSEARESFAEFAADRAGVLHLAGVRRNGGDA